MAAPVEAAMRYCKVCASAGAPLHPVHVCVDHGDGWCVTFCSAQPDRFVYWLVQVTDERLHRIIDRSSIAPSERAGIPRALQAWGRTSFYVHMEELPFRNLARAWREDPRTGYEKLHALPAGGDRKPYAKPRGA